MGEVYRARDRKEARGGNQNPPGRIQPGQLAFEEEMFTETLGRLVTAEPDRSRLPARTPWLIQRLPRRALTKDPVSGCA